MKRVYFLYMFTYIKIVYFLYMFTYIKIASLTRNAHMVHIVN